MPTRDWQRRGPALPAGGRRRGAAAPRAAPLRPGRARGEPPCATRLAALRGCLTLQVSVMTAGEGD